MISWKADFSNLMLEEPSPLSLVYYLNTGHASSRRREIEYHLTVSKIDARRFSAVNPEFVRRIRIFRDRTVYSSALSQRLAIRMAREQAAETVVLLSDDVKVSPQFASFLRKPDLPEDWGMIYFGCQHIQTPEVVSGTLVRVAKAIPADAIAVNREYFTCVINKLGARQRKRRPVMALSDLHLELQNEIPVFATHPNIVEIPSRSLLAHAANLPDRTYRGKCFPTTIDLDILKQKLAGNTRVELTKLLVSPERVELPGWTGHVIGSEYRSSDDILLPFPDCSFNAIYACGLLEPASRQSGEAFLRELYRILRPGGRIRIVTEELSALVQLFSSTSLDVARAYVAAKLPNVEVGWATAGLAELFFALVNQPVGRFIYDEVSLECAIHRAGFSKAAKVGINESEWSFFQGMEWTSRIPIQLLEVSCQVWEASKSEEVA